MFETDFRYKPPFADTKPDTIAPSFAWNFVCGQLPTNVSALSEARFQGKSVHERGALARVR